MRSYIVRYMYSIITGGNLTMNSTTTNDNLKSSRRGNIISPTSHTTVRTVRYTAVQSTSQVTHLSV